MRAVQRLPQSIRSRARRTVLGVLPFLLAACGCDATVCVGGVRVRFDRTPVAPYRVELVANGVVQPGAFGTECAVGDPCPSAILFARNLEGPIDVRVITPNGTRTTTIQTLNYRTTKNRSSDCGSCEIADVVALWPR